MSDTPVDQRRSRSHEELLAAARRLPEPPLGEGRREEMRTEFLATVRGLRSSKRARALAARGKGRRLLMVACVLFAGAGFAAAAWRIAARPAPALEPPVAARPPSGEAHRAPAETGVTVTTEAEPAVEVPPPAPLDARSQDRRHTRAPRRLAMTTLHTGESPADVEVDFAQGWSALRAGDFAVAAAAFGRAAGRQSESALSEDACFWRGVAFDRAGRSGEAQKAFSEFLSRYPRSDRAGETAVMLGWLQLRAGDRAGAAAHFGSALDDPSERVRGSAQAGLAVAGRRYASW